MKVSSLSPGLSPLRPATAAAADPENVTWLVEQPEDRRRFRFALAAAAVAHLLLFGIRFPDAESSPLPAAEKPRVYVVQQPRFEPPPPRQQEELPPQRVKQVPIPDPDPTDPEPIRSLDEIATPSVDLPQSDLVFDIPAPPPVEPAPVGPLSVGGEVSAPVRISGSDPLYSELARRARIQGTVIVNAVIDKQGRVVDLELVKGLPMGLSEATMNAMREWRFRPGLYKGKPVDVRYVLKVEFGIQ